MITKNELKQGINQVDNKLGYLQNEHTLFYPLGGVFVESIAVNQVPCGTKRYLLYKVSGCYVLVELCGKVSLFSLIDNYTDIYGSDFYSVYGTLGNCVKLTKEAHTITSELKFDRVAFTEGFWLEDYPEYLFKNKSDFIIVRDTATASTYYNLGGRYKFSLDFSGIESFKGQERKKELERRLSKASLTLFTG